MQVGGMHANFSAVYSAFCAEDFAPMIDFGDSGGFVAGGAKAAGGIKNGGKD